MNNLKSKLKELPKEPGVYLFKNKQGDTIYVGKAAILKNRVSQYFRPSGTKTALKRDPKTSMLVAEIADIDWLSVDSEIDALFLEAELVRRYMPHYNILLRDDKSSLYVRIDTKSTHPTLSYTRRPLDDGASYFGPYFSGAAVKKALKYLRRIYPYSTHYRSVPKRACLLYHIGLCPGLEENKTTLTQYRKNLQKLIHYLKGNRKLLISQTKKEMEGYSKQHDYEAAAKARDQLRALQALKSRIVFSDKELFDASKDQALIELQQLVGLKTPPRRIEGFDISHIQGSDNVASMVVFINGVPDKAAYRKFKMHLKGNDDFAHMKEVITRRLRESNLKTWGCPDVCIIDGGKGQLNSAIGARDSLVSKNIAMLGLAKKEETIIIKKSDATSGFDIKKNFGAIVKESDQYLEVVLPKNSHLLKLLQRIRDESHRFAVNYHSLLASKRQTASALDNIAGIGPKTRRKLLRAFGSTKGILNAPKKDLQQIVGAKKADLITAQLDV